MGRIQVLTDRVANQIAAGEVVERPASVCKELIENSIDAGARQLRIELKAGGRSLIQVSDNGTGMSRDDAMLAFERHSTSKLRQARDLLAIATLGFRGEALPSIASVARVTLQTRAEDEQSGTIVEMHGGRMRDVREAALATGTSITVRDLFYNVPARRKFLRTEKTELSHAVRVATHYSLAHLDKSFHLRNEHGVLLNVTPVETRRERVYQVFGGRMLEQLVELEPGVHARDPHAVPGSGVSSEAGDNGSRSTSGEGSLCLGGFVSEPQVQRLNRSSVYIFVNRRLVRDSLIQKAIASAYENLMPKGAFPFVLLFLELPASEVDVNVHPAKTEVRFRSPSQVFDFVRDTIRERLIAAKPASKLPLPAQAAPRLPGPEASEGRLPRSSGRPAWMQSGEVKAPPSASERFGFSDGRHFPAVDSSSAGPWSQPSSLDPALPEAAAADDAGHSRAPLVERGPTSLVDLSGLRLLGQLHQSFIVAAGDDGVWIIDQHVAHERILFEKVLAARLHGRAEMQRLLLPIVLTLTPPQAIAYEELAEELRANGFESEPFGGRTVAVQAAPAELPPQHVEALLFELLEHSESGLRSVTLADFRKRVAATVACHAAIKINMPLAPEKMRWLLDELARTDCPMSCPHGRPIALKYGTRDILKAFHRL